MDELKFFRNGEYVRTIPSDRADLALKIAHAARKEGHMVRIERHGDSGIEYLQDDMSFGMEYADLSPVERPKRVYEATGRPPGRPRVLCEEPRRMIRAALTEAEIVKVQDAGNGNLSAGIRKAIELLPD